MNAPKDAMLLIVLVIASGVTAVVLLMWLFQAWRRSLGRRRQKPRSDLGTDPWVTAGKRLRVDETERDEGS